MKLNNRKILFSALFIVLSYATQSVLVCAAEAEQLVDLTKKYSEISSQIFNIKFSRELLIKDLETGKITQIVSSEGMGTILGPEANLFNLSWKQNLFDGDRKPTGSVLHRASYNGQFCIHYVEAGGVKLYEVFSNSETLNRDFETLIGRKASPMSFLVGGRSIGDLAKMVIDPSWSVHSSIQNSGISMLSLTKEVSPGSDEEKLASKDSINVNCNLAEELITGYDFVSTVSGTNLSQVVKSSLDITNFQTLVINDRPYKLASSFISRDSQEGKISNETKVAIDYVLAAPDKNYSTSKIFTTEIEEGSRINDRRNGVSYIAGKPVEVLIENLDNIDHNKSK